ncbi:MAG: hypothetical protein ABWX90_02535 [Candidatus Saccharimonadales bacterium]
MIDKKLIKQHAKEAISTTGEVQYPDLLMYIAQKLIHPALEEIVESLEEKGLVTVADSHMGTIITKVKKKG